MEIPSNPSRPQRDKSSILSRSQKISLWTRGDYQVWLTGGALAVCLFLILAMVAVIIANGASFFWPRDVVLYDLKDGKKVLAITRQKEKIAAATAREQGLSGHPFRRLVMVGNRDVYGQDFVWLNDVEIASESKPRDAWVMERHEYGNFIGYLKSLDLPGGQVEGAEASRAFPRAVEEGQKLFRRMHRLEKRDIGKVNLKIEDQRLARLRAERDLRGEALARELAGIDTRAAALQQQYNALVAEVTRLRKEGQASQVELLTAQGDSRRVPLVEIIDVWRPNDMGVFAKCWNYLRHLAGFFWDDPRESNTEGGIFPAIFGTSVMVILMSVAVVPFGVMTAFYLCEYAKQGPLVRAVRIAVNNLAGVPSIVYGIFGLGFFVYFVGGSIDRLFYPEALPNPTWGTGGILWASLTLALLTLPVVILATEESIQSVPRLMREGSFALGASKFQTLKNILLPASVPGILTGVILAMARGAGEVAPLMITGVVKLAPSLVVDDVTPYFHFERKFMHLGFHIYDVGFQSPNVEASRPMVFATALLLLFLVVALNLGAILLRDHFRKRFKTGAFN